MKQDDALARAAADERERLVAFAHARGLEVDRALALEPAVARDEHDGVLGDDEALGRELLGDVLVA